MHKLRQDKPAIKPNKQICDTCENHGICPAEIGQMNYRCPKINEQDS